MIAAGVCLALVGVERPKGPARESARLLQLIDRKALVCVTEGSRGSGDAYFIDRFEVTNREFGEFVRSSSYRAERGDSFLRQFSDPPAGVYPEEIADHPVVFVSQDDALAFAAWLGAETDLPTAEEWTRVAREAERKSRYGLNALETGIGGTTRVGTFEHGRTAPSSAVEPAVYDLMGNVWEWTGTPGGMYSTTKVVKGGAFNVSHTRVDADSVQVEEPDNRAWNLGFRCVVRDAGRLVRRLLELAAAADRATASRIQESLCAFGEPMTRLLHRIRFEDAARGALPEGGGVDDLIVALRGGRVVILDGRGRARVFDAASGALLAERAGFPEFYYAEAADLDGDGLEELYVAAAAPRVEEDEEEEEEGEEAEPRADFRIECGTRVQPRLVEKSSGRVLSWAPGAEALGDVMSEAFSTKETRAEGYVPRYLQTLMRLEVEGGEIVTRWRVETPVSARPLPLGEGSGLLLLPCLYWHVLLPPDSLLDDVRLGFQDEGSLDLRVLRAIDGSLVESGLIPGGCFGLQAIDASGSLFHLNTWRRHEILVRRDAGVLAVAPFPGSGDGSKFEGLLRGPEPHAATMLRVLPDESHRAGRVLVRCYDAEGRVAAETSLPAGGGRTPRLHTAPDAPGIVVAPGDDSLILLEPDLSVRWRRGGFAEVDLEQGSPVWGDFEGDERAEFAASWRVDGCVLIDSGQGTLLDRFENPGAALLRLTRARPALGKDLLLAAFRDLGISALRRPASPADRTARRLLERLDPLAGTR